MAEYLTTEEFGALTIMPAEHVDEIEARYPGWILGQLTSVSRWIDDRLRKRYAVPFAEPYPETAKQWLCRIVTLRCYLKRGIDPTDEQFPVIKDDHDTARAEVQEAAESEHGLFELPLRSDTTATGVSKGGPRVYSEASPYVWTDVQREIASDEDRHGGGT